MDQQLPRSPSDAAISDGLVGPGLPWRQLDVVAETGCRRHVLKTFWAGATSNAPTAR